MQRRHHILRVLHELHWLPVWECIKFKVACMICQSLFRQVPLHLADDCYLCLTAHGALCGQLMFRLLWCHAHSAATATELLQQPVLVCGTHFLYSCMIQTSPMDCSDDSWMDTSLVAWARRSVTSDMWSLGKKHTYLLKPQNSALLSCLGSNG